MSDNENMVCGTCLYNKNCQFLAKHNGKNMTGCTAYKDDIVFCEDCRYYMPYENPFEDFDGWCWAGRGETDKDEFCNRGKPREQA